MFPRRRTPKRVYGPKRRRTPRIKRAHVQTEESHIRQPHVLTEEIPMGRIHKLRLAQRITASLTVVAAATAGLLLLKSHFKKPAKPSAPPEVKRQKTSTAPASRLVPRKRF